MLRAKVATIRRNQREARLPDRPADPDVMSSPMVRFWLSTFLDLILTSNFFPSVQFRALPRQLQGSHPLKYVVYFFVLRAALDSFGAADPADPTVCLPCFRKSFCGKRSPGMYCFILHVSE